ncbi:MAG: bifunctional nuclease family protein [Gemmatimonadaceae bacterium]
MMFAEVEVMRLGIDRASNAYVVILREKGGDRLLPIWIGQPEAESIVIEMHQVRRERPLTHDLCKSLIVHLGATLRRVQITRVASRTYFAEMHLASRDGSVIVDARPSDSIAIALRFGAPLFAEDSLLTAAAVIEEASGDEAEPESASESETEPGPMSGEELKAYLERLRPEDFGKFQP